MDIDVPNDDQYPNDPNKAKDDVWKGVFKELHQFGQLINPGRNLGCRAILIIFLVHQLHGNGLIDLGVNAAIKKPPTRPDNKRGKDQAYQHVESLEGLVHEVIDGKTDKERIQQGTGQFQKNKANGYAYFPAEPFK